MHRKLNRQTNLFAAVSSNPIARELSWSGWGGFKWVFFRFFLSLTNKGTIHTLQYLK